MDTILKEQILEQLDQLPYESQRQVLDFIQVLSLTRPKGVSGQTLLTFAGSIPQDDLTAMAAAIETECEQVDQDDW